MQYIFFSLIITLVALIMIQSHVADATFLCDRTGTALCVRPATPDEAKGQRIVRARRGNNPLVNIVTPAHTSSQGQFTCAKVNVKGFTVATTTRYCCKQKLSFTVGTIYGFVQGDLQNFGCTNRGGPP